MAKKKGSKGGNPNPPKTPEFLAQQFPAAADVPPEVELAKNALCVKLPVDVDAKIRSLPDKSAWLRKVIIEAANKELP